MATSSSSGVGNGARGAGGVGTDCEGEEQDEPSSSSSSRGNLQEAFESLTVDDKKTSKEEELSAFREKWVRELQPTRSPSPQPERPSTPIPPDAKCTVFKVQPKYVCFPDEFAGFKHPWERAAELEETRSPRRESTPTESDPPDEEKAKQLFRRGVELERAGQVYEAIQHYKRAMQILPDVENRHYESMAMNREDPEEELEAEERRVEPDSLSEDEDAIVGEDLFTRLQRKMARKGRLCEPEVPNQGAHISWLPYELVLQIVTWVVGSELDTGSLENLAAVSRGMYLAARDPAVWRDICLETWGPECGTPRAHGFLTWRHMYIDRPRLNLAGCYISRTTYMRHGEHTVTDQFYKPWYVVAYYRYLRFFPDGLVLSWTTPDEPASCVGQLKTRMPKQGLGIMMGHYRLMGEQVLVVLKRSSNDKKSSQSARFRARRRNSDTQHELTFHLEFELRTVRRRRNFQLWWRRYAVCSAGRREWTTFELTPSKYPAFIFSRVRQYTQDAHAPLPHAPTAHI